MAVVVGPANLLQSPVLQLSDCQFVPQNSPSLNFHFSSFLTSTLLIFFMAPWSHFVNGVGHKRVGQREDGKPWKSTRKRQISWPNDSQLWGGNQWRVAAEAKAMHGENGLSGGHCLHKVFESNWNGGMEERYGRQSAFHLCHTAWLCSSPFLSALRSIRTADANWPLSSCDIQFTVTHHPPILAFALLSLSLSLDFMWPSSDENSESCRRCVNSTTTTQKSVNELLRQETVQFQWKQI